MAIARLRLQRANLIAATHSILWILQPKIAAARRGLLVALVVAAGTIHGGAVLAQTAPAILAPGNAAVTGFSGAAPPQTIAPGADPEDKTFIDLNGPAFRIIDLQNMGGPPAAQLVGAPKPYTATAAQIGQVFAAALDNATPPSIYVAATSAYGLPIVVGPNRTKRGRAGATFMPGLFGPRAQNGGPGSIWKIDGRSGAITRFANVTLNGADNPGPALGGLAFDPGSNTLLAADRSTGMIHRFDLSGAERGVYDHGIQGRLAAQLPPLPYDPSRRLDITKPSFDSTNPATWGFAAPDRLIFGLAVRAGRLYYAVAANMQIWSVGVAPNGAFGTDARVEITVPPSEGPSEISKITFDDEGRMLLAERPIPTGDYGFDLLTQEGIGRVLRYARQPDGTWQQEPDEYAIGFPLHLRNGNGGVAVGYSYAASGAIDRATCGGYLWSTGEQLRVSHDAAVAAQLAQGGAQIVNGLQGNAIALVRPANVPPLQSYYVDFDDKFDDPDARGYMGDIAIYRVCGLVQLPSGARLPPGFALPPSGLALPPGLLFPPGGPPLPPPPPQTCLPGTTPQPGYQCCREGTYMDATGQCASICPPGIDPNQTTSGTPNSFFCGFGFDPTTYDQSNLNNLRCIGGATPDWNAIQNNPNNFMYLCLSHSLYFNPPICPAGSSRTTLGQLPATGIFPGPTGIPAIDNQPVCGPTAQQQACTRGQQIGADGQCHQLCPAGSDSFAYPIPPTLIAQCCPAGSVVTPSGQCCPPGSIIDPATGQCLPPPPPSDCPPGTVRQPGFQCCPEFTSWTRAASAPRGARPASIPARSPKV